ncbi:sulphate transporter [Pseudofrankia inefficax]|uniref:Sulphate transporter n=1 Tax=Pseudofrankia inefficax (strain DSM 45817 / CECT 9037 / DDB 130130 / EuI1c) TaxID=298654 RepID=E3J7Y5_PSEI1|nr:sulphate transporter [Pseudofrankia inefficax]
MAGRVIAATMRGYRVGWLRRDVVAGLMLVAIAVPEQMATAGLAGAPAVAGLYAFVAGSVLFALLGRHPQLSVGADSTIAPVMAIGVGGVATVGTPGYAHLLAVLALLVGGLVVAVGLLRLGWISQFLSTPVVTGVLAGIAAQILVHQLPAVLGVPGGGTTTIGRVRAIAAQLGHVTGWAVGIALGVLAIIVLTERVDRRIPGALIGVVGSILVVFGFGLASHGVAVVGAIDTGMPSFGLASASLADVRALVGPALTVAFICVVQSAATERGSGTAARGSESFNRDLVAVGAGSLASGLTGSFAVNASPPRTEVVVSSGGRSQAGSLVAAGLVVVLLATATQSLEYLPRAALGAILVFVASRLLRVGEFRSILRFDRLEFVLAIITALAVALVGIEQGVLVAMLLSLADRTWRAARPRDAVLGREPGTEHWIPSDVGQPVEQVPGVLVYLPYAPLWYGNAEFIAVRLRAVLDATTPPVHAFVLDANGISDIDYTGARMLGELATELRHRGVTMGVARSSHLVHHDLKHAGLVDAIGPERIYATVDQAVDDLTGPPSRPADDDRPERPATGR